MRLLLLIFIAVALAGCSGADTGQMTDCMVRCVLSDTLWVEHGGEWLAVPGDQIKELTLHPDELQIEVKRK